MLEPKVYNVLEGDAAAFVCTVTSRDKQNEDIGWQIDGPRVWQYSVTSMTMIMNNINTLKNFIFENKTIVYSSSYVEERFILRIVNVTKTDER